MVLVVLNLSKNIFSKVCHESIVPNFNEVNKSMFYLLTCLKKLCRELSHCQLLISSLICTCIYARVNGIVPNIKQIKKFSTKDLVLLRGSIL